jgi:hypothetical protein
MANDIGNGGREVKSPVGIKNFKSTAINLFLDIKKYWWDISSFLLPQVTPIVAPFLPRLHGFAARTALVGCVLEKAGFQQLSVSVHRGFLVKITDAAFIAVNIRGMGNGPIGVCSSAKTYVHPITTKYW